MKKKNSLRFLFLLVMVASVLLSALSLSAYADFTGTYRKGQTVSRTIVYACVDNTINSASIDSGSLPNGMSLSKDANNIYLSGTPDTVGSYSCTLSVDTAYGFETVYVSVDIIESETAPTVAPTATPAPLNNEPPKITKNPTGETVEPGGSAKFIARADNAKYFVWRLVSADTTNTVPAEDGPSYFSGLKVSGTDSDTLVLSNIPQSLDGWCAECKFVNDYGTSFTTGAIITVKSKTPQVVTTPAPTPTTNNVKAPVINTQPRGVNQTIGSGATLTVKAISTDGGTLAYQWYSSTTSDTGDLTEIPGETGSSFTPPQTEGTVYYCVAITNSKDGKTSDTLYSNKAAVTYAQPTVPSQATPTLAPITNGYGDTVEPTPTASSTPRPSDNGGGMNMTTSLIFFGVTGVLALAALVVIIIFLKKNAKEE